MHTCNSPQAISKLHMAARVVSIPEGWSNLETSHMIRPRPHASTRVHVPGLDQNAMLYVLFRNATPESLLLK